MSVAPITDGPDGLDVRQAARRGLALVALVLLLVVALRALPGLDEVGDRLASAAPAWLALAIACELGSVLSFPLALHGAFSRVMPLRVAVSLGLAEQGANVLVPAGGTGGLAFGALWLRRRGVPTAAAATRTVVLFLATSLMTFLAVIAAGLAIGFGAESGDVPGYVGLLLAAGAASVIGALVFVARMPASGTTRANRLATLVARLGASVREGAQVTIALLRRRDALLIGGAIGYLAFDIAALAAVAHALGGDFPPLAAFVLAYTVGQAGAMIPSPGGVGGTEGGLVAMFVLCGTSLSAATAAVFAYRILQVGLPAALGMLASLDLRRLARTGPTPQEVAESQLTAKLALGLDRAT
ncbi:MAG TPA: lysylphosphatidylglycerol synthase transmembrane domain-containing protein [Solirubrobacteraceae bacterium]|nr:lysylphosphatidylglycerol synthase transmembrane domain-containing protein [Solirubrobacteraceae bacterium]